MLTILRLRALLSIVAAALPFAAAAWTDADYEVESKFRRDRVTKAHVHELEGDRLLASGNAEAALDKYVLGLRSVALRGRLGFDWRKVRDGLEITEVTPELPMAKAGVRPGDVLTRVRGLDAERLGEGEQNVIFMRDAGEPVPLAVRRGSSSFEAAPVSWHAVWNAGYAEISTQETELIAVLRRKAAKAAAGIGPPFQVPPLARMHATLAQSQAKSAKTPAEFDNASGQYRIASMLAPRWLDLYVNHAIFQEAIEDAIGARENLALYLEAAPQAPDRDAVRQKFEALAGKALEQKQLLGWDGFWGQVVNGRPTDSGVRFERKGRLLSAKNAQQVEYIRATISDELNATVVQRFTVQNSGHLGPVIQRCFNGVLEMSGSMRRSPDLRTLTITTVNDFSIDPRSCQIQGSTPSTLTYRR